MSTLLCKHCLCLQINILLSFSCCICCKGDRQELLTNMERLKARCEAVTMEVQTVRDQSQTQSLHKVNSILHDLRSRLFTETDTIPVTAMQQARSYLNACLPETAGAIDSRFQSLVLGCALDDQKDVRRRLESLVREYSTGYRPASPDPSRGNGSDQYDSNNSTESTDFVYVSGDHPAANATSMGGGPSGETSHTMEHRDNGREDHVDNFSTPRFHAPPRDSFQGANPSLVEQSLDNNRYNDHSEADTKN
jgi:BCL2-associated athanogene 2